MSKIEILAPVGSEEMLHAAVFSGADAVYLGFSGFNARTSAGNFDADSLKEAVRFCHVRGVKVHVALNTTVYGTELAQLADAVRAVGAPHFGDAQPRDARRREFRLRMQQPDLLFERHPRKSVLDTLFKRLRLVQIDGHIAPGLLDARAGDRREGAQCGNALYISFGFHSKIYLK